MAENGRNPMRWDCTRDGCFNIKCRPKIEMFAECFPGRISLGDVDGIVEINGYFLVLEWKSRTKKIPRGQEILFAQLTAPMRRTTVVVVHGDAETMVIDEIQVWQGGRSEGWEPCSIEALKDRIRRWASSHARAAS